MVLDSDDDGAHEIDSDDAWSDDEDAEAGVDSNGPSSLLHPRDLGNFFKLCSALIKFLSHELTEDDLSEGDNLIREYCIELLEVGHAFITYRCFH